MRDTFNKLLNKSKKINSTVYYPKVVKFKKIKDVYNLTDKDIESSIKLQLETFNSDNLHHNYYVTSKGLLILRIIEEKIESHSNIVPIHNICLQSISDEFKKENYYNAFFLFEKNIVILFNGDEIVKYQSVKDVNAVIGEVKRQIYGMGNNSIINFYSDIKSINIDTTIVDFEDKKYMENMKSEIIKIKGSSPLKITSKKENHSIPDSKIPHVQIKSSGNFIYSLITTRLLIGLRGYTYFQNEKINTLIEMKTEILKTDINTVQNKAIHLEKVITEHDKNLTESSKKQMDRLQDFADVISNNSRLSEEILIEVKTKKINREGEETKGQMSPEITTLIKNVGIDIRELRNQMLENSSSQNVVSPDNKDNKDGLKEIKVPVKTEREIVKEYINSLNIEVVMKNRKDYVVIKIPALNIQPRLVRGSYVTLPKLLVK